MTAFNSDAIYVFPCARKGGSSLASEYNFTHLSGRVSNKTSYVIGKVNNILQVVLDGYYFEIKDEDIDSLCTKKLILWLETLPESDNTGGWAHVTRRVCGVKYEDRTGTWIKQQYLDNDGQFSALYPAESGETIASDRIAAGLTYVCLNLNDTTNWVDNIHKGIEDKLVGIEGTVADYVNTALTSGDYAKDADLTVLADRVTDLEDTYATKTELDVVEDKADSNTSLITNLTGRLNEIVEIGGEPNTINTIKVNGVIQTIDSNKAIDITVPVIADTMISQLNDGQALLNRTTDLETAIENITNAETGAIATAVAEEAKARDKAINDKIGTVAEGSTVVDMISAVEDKIPTDVSTFNNDAGYLVAADIDSLDKTVTANNNAITILNGDVNTKDSVDNKIKAAIDSFISSIYTIAFDANGGTGTMAPVICISNKYRLPEGEPSFIPPNGKKFQAWGLKTQGEDTITAIDSPEIEISSNTVIYAMWTDSTET